MLLENAPKTLSLFLLLLYLGLSVGIMVLEREHSCLFFLDI